jgi:hypothetical protein
MRLFLTTIGLLTASLALPGAARADWVWPLHGELITAYRNGDDPYAGGQHRGIDIAGPVGARVVAASGGVVRFAGTAGSSGLTVSVRTADGRFDTSYLHLRAISVGAGEQVSAGQMLGAVGTTGSRSASEPHLHFGVREAGTSHAYRNPLDLLPPRSAPPAPEAPQPTPAPVPTPAAPAPSPAPWRVPAGERVPRGAPAAERAPRRVPAGERAPRRVPVGDRAPRRVPSRAPRAVPGRAPRAVPRRTPHSAPAGRPAPVHAPVGDLVPRRAAGQAPAADPIRPGAPHADGVPDAGPAGGRAPSLAAGPDGRRSPDIAGLPRGADGQVASPGPEASRQSAGGTDGSAAGPDVGWILACVGLLAAAAMLGLTEDGRNATRTGHRRIVRLLRPLVGRG